MAIFKCKMCGGSLDVSVGTTIIECEYCGTVQTLPKLEDDRRANLYDRANHFRRNNDFDKAAGIYESILNEDANDAEAYWSLVLCRYGIEYVEDPATHKRIPTVNRAQFTSIYDDENYKSAIEHASIEQKEIYEREAKAINEIQKGILEISTKEEPFDVFICYKETDASGNRTHDSVLAQELYYQLTGEGFKVFFSRITLEDKLGSAYEPYIFAALNSAKVMVVLGTKPEYFNAVWVKNEWSRYLSLIRGGAKKTLIPAYRDVDPYDLPAEFSHLQAQDMSKLGFMQDLIRGIEKIIGGEKPKAAKVEAKTETPKTAGKDVDPLLRRARLFLEDGDWESANEYAEKVLDTLPECAEAYIIKLLVDLQLGDIESLATYNKPINENPNYKKALRFAAPEVVEKLISYAKTIDEKAEEAKQNDIYTRASIMMKNARTFEDYQKAKAVFNNIPDYKDSADRIKECNAKAEVMKQQIVYSEAVKHMNNGTISSYKEAIRILSPIKGYKDAEELINRCKSRIAVLETALEQEAAKRNKKKTIIIISVIIAITIAISCAIIIPIADENARNGLNLELNSEGTGYVVMPPEAGEEKYSGNIVIPSEYMGKPVVAIANDAFYKCSYLTSVTIGNGVTSIGEGAFKYCDVFTSITIPDSVTSIGDYAFYKCSNLTSVTIGNGVTTIGKEAFEYCSNLTSVTIGNSVTSIGGGAFNGCTSLTSITIPNSVTSIGEMAFNGCTSLTSITIPNSVTRIGERAFYWCENLTSITIPDGATSISSYAFYGCTSLTSITIPDSVTSISRYAFYKCDSLTSIKYRGTQTQWNAIEKGSYWDTYTGNYTITYNYTGK